MLKELAKIFDLSIQNLTMMLSTISRILYPLLKVNCFQIFSLCEKISRFHVHLSGKCSLFKEHFSSVSTQSIPKSLILLKNFQFDFNFFRIAQFSSIFVYIWSLIKGIQGIRGNKFKAHQVEHKLCPLWIIFKGSLKSWNLLLSLKIWKYDTLSLSSSTQMGTKLQLSVTNAILPLLLMTDDSDNKNLMFMLVVYMWAVYGIVKLSYWIELFEYFVSPGFWKSFVFLIFRHFCFF